MKYNTRPRLRENCGVAAPGRVSGCEGYGMMYGHDRRKMRKKRECVCYDALRIIFVILSDNVDSVCFNSIVCGFFFPCALQYKQN